MNDKTLEIVAKFLAEKDGYNWKAMPEYIEDGMFKKLCKEYWIRLANDIIALMDSVD